ncbi:hypothetical protein [Gordonia soli]|uniref:Uncharacterized protein n=1 Tax=Gordonia soli NBRC 108243 TaxID=1223545 RepID=M0QR80_9ACTN|nr:hypothetical protein [Gordonia soli]GAC70796.1 hypothetical protein GS4_41_00430 [Gordonia soli NBRC 108243]
MTAASAYDSANIAPNVVIAATSTAVRDAREALGTAYDALSKRCAQLGYDLSTMQESKVQKTTHRVAVTDPRGGRRFAVYGDSLTEALDMAADRLNRGEWGR